MPNGVKKPNNISNSDLAADLEDKPETEDDSLTLEYTFDNGELRLEDSNPDIEDLYWNRT